MKAESAEKRFRVWDVPRAMWFFLAEARWKYVTFIVLLVLALFYNMVPPWITGVMANLLIESAQQPASAQGKITQVLWLIVFLVITHIAVSLLRLWSKRQLGELSFNARYRAKVWGFERLLDASLVWHQQENTGNKAQRVLTGAEALREWIGEGGNDLISSSITFLGALIACLFLHPLFLVFFAVYLAILLAIEVYFDRRISQASDQINQSLENASGVFVEGAANVLAVKALGAGGGMVERVEEREALARELSFQRLRFANKKWMWFQIHNGVFWGLFLALVAYRVVHGYLAAGFFMTYSLYFHHLREAALEVTNRLQTLIERKSNLARMMPLFWHDNALEKGKLAFPEDWQALYFDAVTFRYTEQAAVGPLSLKIARGEMIGVAGSSGSGKSTLIKLLLGLYHVQAGRLRFDAADVHAIRHEALTEKVAVVLQETEVFNLSVKENITMLREVPAEVLARACRIACLDELLARLPEGIQTKVGERGYSLSGGERQRLGIARALCREADILLLDEATSALDSITEQRIMAGLLALKKTPTEQAPQTMIIVAHRISTLREVDRVLVFERGQLLEDGRFADLVHDANTRFGALYAAQRESVVSA